MLTCKLAFRGIVPLRGWYDRELRVDEVLVVHRLDSCRRVCDGLGVEVALGPVRRLATPAVVELTGDTHEETVHVVTLLALGRAD